MRIPIFLSVVLFSAPAFSQAISSVNKNVAPPSALVVSQENLGPALLNELTTTAAIVGDGNCIAVSLCQTNQVPAIWRARCRTTNAEIFASAYRTKDQRWLVTNGADTQPCVGPTSWLQPEVAK